MSIPFSEIGDRTTPFMLVPETDPDGRLVFLERDLGRGGRIGVAVLFLAVAAALVALMRVGAAVNHVVEVCGWILVGLFTLASVTAAVLAALYAPVDRELVIDASGGRAGVREMQKGVARREWARPLADCRFERGYLGSPPMKSMDTPVLFFSMPAEPQDIRIVLAAVRSQYLDEYCELLPAAIRDRIVTTNEHRTDLGRVGTPAKGSDYRMLCRVRRSLETQRAHGDHKEPAS